VQRLAQLLEDGAAERVALLGAVQDDVTDRVAVLADDEAHGR
jgi:hypothetical protein